MGWRSLSARSLEETCQKGTILAGALLLDLANKDSAKRLIDGELSGYRHDRPDPWIVLRTVDSTWWDVEGEESDVLETRQCTTVALVEEQEEGTPWRRPKKKRARPGVLAESPLPAPEQQSSGTG